MATVMSESPDVELLRCTWEAIAEGDLSVMEAALAADAKWRAIEDGP
jgi:ketosteroid isomerase-like protein